MSRSNRPTAIIFPLLAAALLALAPARSARAQRFYREELPAPQAIVQDVSIEQKLDTRVPADLTFRDESGRTVRLGDYFNQGKKPVVLSLVYFGCPSLCTMTLNGMATSFRPLGLEIGKDFDVVTVSFDPTETPELARGKKDSYVKSLNRPGTEAGWHFLTGDAANIKRLTEATGFRYVYDENSKQYAHASAIMVLTPGGKLSRYLYGLEYSSKDLRLALVEASDNKIGTLADQVLRLCYQYDPLTGRYGLAIVTGLRVAAVTTVLTLGGFIVWWLRRERRGTAPAAAANPLTTLPGAAAAGAAALPSTTRA